jgi:DNA-directed RNA polymerase specialized sigma subunit
MTRANEGVVQPGSWPSAAADEAAALEAYESLVRSIARRYGYGKDEEVLQGGRIGLLLALGAANGLMLVPWIDPAGARGHGQARDRATLVAVRSLLRQLSLETKSGGLPTRQSQKVASAVESLNPRYRRIVILHYGLFGGPRRTQVEISRRLNISKERVRHHVRQALATLSRHPDVAQLISSREQ